MKRILIITALLFITILNYAQVPFKVYGDLQEFKNFKWFLKPKPMVKATSTDTILLVRGNQFYGAIATEVNEPDSLYIQYSDTCLTDTSGWVMSGDTIFIDTCGRGELTYSYNPYTNILIIGTDTIDLNFEYLWVKVTQGGMTFLNPLDNDNWNVGLGGIPWISRLAIIPKDDQGGIYIKGKGFGEIIDIQNNRASELQNAAPGYETMSATNLSCGTSIKAQQSTTAGETVVHPMIQMLRYSRDAVTQKEPFILMRDTNIVDGTLGSYWVKSQYLLRGTPDITTTKWSVSYAGQEYLADTLFTDKAVMATQTLNAGDPASTTTQVYAGGLTMGDLNTFPDFVSTVKNVIGDTTWEAQMTTGEAIITARQDTNNNTSIYLDSDSNFIYNNTRLGLSNGIVDADSNYTQFDKDGHVTLHGKATVWDDLFFPFGTGETAGTGYPAFVADSGYYTFVVDTTGVNKCIKYFTIQMPHSWKLSGSKIYPHVHYKYETGVGAPKFIMKYKWYNTGESTDFGWKWYRMDLSTGSDDKTIQKMYSTEGITPPEDLMKISSILICQVYLRDNPTNVHAYQFDIHIEMDSMGSNTETGK